LSYISKDEANSINYHRVTLRHFAFFLCSFLCGKIQTQRAQRVRKVTQRNWYIKVEECNADEIIHPIEADSPLKPLYCFVADYERKAGPKLQAVHWPVYL